jgi:hypothetical protein
VVGELEDDGPGAAPCITVDIEQRGREWKGKHSWHHEWREVSRRVDARPFYVVRPNGERVRVEPDQNVFLVDRLDGTDRFEHARRRRTATLRPGEKVAITGVLVRGFDPRQGGYRDAAPALVLKPPPRGRMLVSTEPLADRHRTRASTYRGLAIAVGVLLAFSHGLLFANVHLQRFGAKRVSATIERVSSERYWVSRKGGGGHWAWRYFAHARSDDGRTLTDQIGYPLYINVQRSPGLRPRGAVSRRTVRPSPDRRAPGDRRMEGRRVRDRCRDLFHRLHHDRATASVVRAGEGRRDWKRKAVTMTEHDSPFARATAVARIDSDADAGTAVYRAEIPDGWQMGRGAFGGLVLGTLLRAVERVEPDRARVPRTLSGDLGGPVQPGAAELRVRRLRRGSNQSNLAAELAQGGEVLATATVIASAPRAISAPRFEPAPPVAVGPFTDYPPIAVGPPLAPVFTQHYEYRPIGPAPFGGAPPLGEATCDGFVREREAPRQYDAPAMIGLLDAWWPTLFGLDTRPRPLATISFTAQLLVDPATIPAGEPLRYRARMAALADGFFVELRELWSGGRPVALNQQMFAIIK